MLKRLLLFLFLVEVCFGQVSSYPPGGSGGAINGVAVGSMPSTTVGFSATPNYICNSPVTATLFKMTLTGNVTGPTFDATCTSGLILGVELTQDGTGGWTFSSPSGYDGCAIEPAANSTTTIIWDANGKRISCDSVLWTAVNTQTNSYTLLASDAGKLVTVNGTSKTATLPNPPPSAAWYAWIQNLNSTALTISRNSLTINGGTSNITLQQYQRVKVEASGANYNAEVPIIAGTSITLTPAANGITVASSGASGRWVVCLDPTKTACRKDDFQASTSTGAGVGEMAWTIAVANGATQVGTSVAGRPGVETIQTNTTASGCIQRTVNVLTPGSSGFANLANDVYDNLWMIRVPVNDGNLVARFGMNGSALSGCSGNIPTGGAYFEKQAADTSWFGVCMNASTPTRTSAVAAVDTSFHEFRIQTTAAGTVNFSIDGGTAQTCTSTSNTVATLFADVNNNGSTTNEKIDMDYVDMIVSGLTR